MPVETDDAEVPGITTFTSGSPITVVTAIGPKPTLFTTEVSGFQVSGPQPSIVYIGWKGVITQVVQPESIVVRSFQPDGSPLPQAQLNWNVTLEVWFLASS